MFHRIKALYHPLIVPCILAFALYGLNLWTPLFWDDEYFIVKNVFIHRFDIISIFTNNADAGAGIVSEYYRPVSSLTYAVNWLIHRDLPFGYHLFNNSLHVLNGVLLYQVIKKYINRSSALAVCALFLVHPVHVNTIAYVSGRDSLLAAACMFLSILLYEKHSWISLLAFTIALFCRETAIVTPLLILLLTYSQGKKHLSRMIPFASVAFAYLFLRLSVLQFGNTTNLSGLTIPLYERVFTFLGVLSHYFLLILIPHNQHFRINPPRYDSFTLPVMGGVAICLCLGAILCFLYYKKHPSFRIWAIGVGWFFLNLGISSGIVVPLHFSMQEHWLYMPLIGIALIVVNLIRFTPIQGVVAVVVIVLSILTAQRNLVWQSPIAVWEESVRYEKASPLLLNNLGGKYQDAGNNEKATYYYAQSILAGSTVAEPYYNLAGILWSKKEYVRARELFDRAIATDPQFIKAYISAAGMQGEQGNWSAAHEYLVRGLEASTSESDRATIQKMLDQVQLFMSHETSGIPTSK